MIIETTEKNALRVTIKLQKSPQLIGNRVRHIDQWKRTYSTEKEPEN